MKLLSLPAICGAALLFSSLPAFAEVDSASAHMLGKQSQNTGLPAVPVKTPIKVDGKLDEWDLSGRMWSFGDLSLRDQYSVETAAMWDGEALYLGLQWHDPTPLLNLVNPKTNPNDGWKSDAMQMRIQTDHISWLTAWHNTAENTSNVHLVHLKDPKNEKDVDTDHHFGEPGETDLGGGLQMAFCKTSNAGYSQEIRIPWQMIYRQKPVLKAGDKIQIGFEYFWGDSTSKNWPTFRYADNMQPGQTSREFFWRARKAWGDVELMPKGDLPLRQYQLASTALQGPIKFKLEIPKKAKRFTVVIDDTNGRRVRNLLADVSPAEFAVSDKGSATTVGLAWDGRNDDGVAVAAGTYRARGLWHGGLDAIYDITFFNPGTPPWQTANGQGAWGSNHAQPQFVAAAGDWTIVGWTQSEGGSAIIGLNPDGLKRWGELRGANPLAADKEFVYSAILGEGTETLKESKLMRLSATDGVYKPFVLDGKERTFPLPLSEVLPNKELTAVTALSANNGKLAIGFENGEIVILDSKSAVPLSTFPGRKVTGLAYSDKGDLFAIVDNGLMQVAADGKLSSISTPGLVTAGAIAVDHDGNVLVYDAGADQQVKAFSTAGKLVYTAGKKGGRPIRGDYDEQAMASVTGIAVDSKGQIWAAEHTNYPRRVSVWGRDGKMVRDYVGTTGYAGVGCHLYENDPSLAYVGPMELKLDRANDTYKLKRILWKADETRADEPKTFDVDPQSNAIAHRFRSSAGGVQREFLFSQPNYYFAEPIVLFMEGDTGWRPVSAIGLVGQFSGKIGPRGKEVVEEPNGEFTGSSAWDACIWNDENGDGRVQRKECVIIPSVAKKKGQRPEPSIPLGNSWFHGMNTQDLSFLVGGISRYKPLRFTKDGAPIYGLEGIEKVTPTLQNGLFGTNIPDENLVIGLRSGAPASSGLSPVPGFVGIAAKTGEYLWSYPNLYPGVHGSHSAPMPRAGLLIGPLKIMGVAKVNAQVGNVFAIRGNLGQDFFFTSDGLNIGALFQDCRAPNPSLPDTVAEVKGTSLANYSEGGEPFSGWFGRQSDDKLRLMTSIGRTAGLAVEVKGLDTITRFKGPDLRVTDADLVKIAALAPAQALGAKKLEPYRIVKVAQPLPVEGDMKAWKDIPSVTIAKEGTTEKATAQLAHDATMLYLRFNVTDASPLLNSGNDFKRLFKTGDAVDFQVGPVEPVKRKDPGAQDVRLLLTTMQAKAVAVLMRPKDPKAPKQLAETYTSPVGPKRFNRVEKLEGVAVATKKVGGGYMIVAAVPLATLGIESTAGLKLRGDLGFISSDEKGMTNMARTYWANQATGLVNDEPQESWLYPATGGDLILE